MTVAEVGNIVEFYDGLKGRVEKINDNSVIVDLTIMENFNDLDLPEKSSTILYRLWLMTVFSGKSRSLKFSIIVRSTITELSLIFSTRPFNPS